MTNNSHKHKDFLYDTRPNMSAVTSHYNSHSARITRERYDSGYVPALSSKLNIYDQTRQGPLPVIYGTHFIRYVPPTVIHRPAGLLGQNNTKATGEPLFPKQFRGIVYPQNV